MNRRADRAVIVGAVRRAIRRNGPEMIRSQLDHSRRGLGRDHGAINILGVDVAEGKSKLYRKREQRQPAA